MSIAPGKIISLKRAIGTAIHDQRFVTDVMPFGKLFEAEDIGAVSFGASAAFISVLSAPGEEALAAGDARVMLDIAVAIAAKGTLDMTPDEMSLAIAEAIFIFVGWKQWGIPETGPVKNRRIELMPVPTRKGVALHAVRWNQTTRLGAPYPDPMGVDESLRPAGSVDLTLRGRGDE